MVATAWRHGIPGSPRVAEEHLARVICTRSAAGDPGWHGEVRAIEDYRRVAQPPPLRLGSVPRKLVVVSPVPKC
jgi:hypothetical protein